MGAQIWAIGAGKGGVGKTFVCSSMGITLAKLSYSILLIDFDISGANLHTTLGLPPSQRNLRQVFAGESKLVDVIQGTNIPRLSYIQGFWDSWSPTELPLEQVSALVKECRSLPYDYVIFDLGAGASALHLEIFGQTDEKILITNSEPTSVEKTYRFMESYICSRIRPSSSDEAFQKLLSSLRDYRSSHHRNYFSFRNYLKEAAGVSVDFFGQLREKPVRLIINSARSRLDQDLGYSIKSVCKKYYDLPIDYVGFVDFDNAVWQSIKTKEPVLIEKPFTPIAGQFLAIAKQMTSANLHATFQKEVV